MTNDNGHLVKEHAQKYIHGLTTLKERARAKFEESLLNVSHELEPVNTYNKDKKPVSEVFD